MNKNKSLFNAFEIDYSRIEGTLYEELNLFIANYQIQPMPVVQEMRAFFIAWVTVFFPEVISKDFTEKLKTFIEDHRTDSNFQTNGWLRLLPLDVALFAITENTDCLDVCIANIDHHRSVFRDYVMESLSLVADRLSFNDPELQYRTKSNIKKRQSIDYEELILLIATKGSKDEKLHLVQEWQEEFRKEPWSNEVLESILICASIPNSYFFPNFHKRQIYILLRLFCKVPEQKKGNSEQLHLAIDDEVKQNESARLENQSRLFPKDWASGVLDKVCDRLNSHILLKPEINMQELLDNEKTNA